MRNLAWSVLFFFFYSALSSGNTYFLLLFFEHSLGLSGAQIGWIFGFRAVVTFLAGYPAGFLCSRFSTRRLLGAALGVQALSACFLSQAVTVPQLLGVYLPYVVAAELTGVLFDAIFMSQAADRGPAGPGIICSFQSAKFFGLGIGALGTGYFLDDFAFRGLFWCVAFGLCILSLLSSKIAVIIRKPITEVAKATPAINDSEISFMSFSFLIAMHWGAEIVILPLFLRNELGFTHSLVGVYFGSEVFSLGLTTLMLTLNRHDVTGRQAGTIALLASVVGTVGTAASVVWLSLLFRVVHGIGDALLFAHLFGRMSRLSQRCDVGVLSGSFHAVTMLALACGSVLYSWAGGRAGLGIALALSGIAVLPAIRWLPRGETSDAAFQLNFRPEYRVEAGPADRSM